MLIANSGQYGMSRNYLLFLNFAICDYADISTLNHNVTLIINTNLTQSIPGLFSVVTCSYSFGIWTSCSWYYGCFCVTARLLQVRSETKFHCVQRPRFRFPFSRWLDLVTFAYFGGSRQSFPCISCECEPWVNPASHAAITGKQINLCNWLRESQIFVLNKLCICLLMYNGRLCHQL